MPDKASTWLTPHAGVDLLQLIGQAGLVSPKSAPRKTPDPRRAIRPRGTPPPLSPAIAEPPRAKPSKEAAPRRTPLLRAAPPNLHGAQRRGRKCLAPTGIPHSRILPDFPVHRFAHLRPAPHFIPHPQGTGKRIARERQPHLAPTGSHAVAAAAQQGFRPHRPRTRLRGFQQHGAKREPAFRPPAPCTWRQASKERQTPKKKMKRNAEHPKNK